MWGEAIDWLITQKLRQIPRNTHNSKFKINRNHGNYKWDYKVKIEMCGLCKSISNLRFQIEKKEIVGKHAFLQSFKKPYGCYIEETK